jgi:hypothetical protein
MPRRPGAGDLCIPALRVFDDPAEIRNRHPEYKYRALQLQQAGRSLLPHNITVYITSSQYTLQLITGLCPKPVQSRSVLQLLFTCMYAPLSSHILHVSKVLSYWTRFDTGSVHVGFVVVKVALGQVFPPRTSVFPYQFHSTGALLLGKIKK